MKKFYISNKEELNEQEIKTGCVSYARIVKRYIQSLVLCNEIKNIDDSIYENIINEYENLEIYQYYLCNLNEFEAEILQEYGIILSYSNMLELDILCVDHFGTSWDYVMTDVKWTTDYNES